MSGASIASKEALRVELPDYPVIAALARTHVVVTGPSGTGKSTFCLLLAGVSDATEREAHVWLFGDTLDKMPERQRARRIALVPSDPFLAFTGLKRTLRGELEMIGRLVETSSADGQAFLEDVASRLDLVDHLHRDPFTLSGGEAVRAALAMALVKRPLLLVLDQMHEQLDAEALPRIQEGIAALLPAASLVFETRSRGMLGPITACEDEQPNNVCRWRVDLRSLDAREAALAYILKAPADSRPASETVEEKERPVLRIAGLKHRYSSSGFSLGPIDLRVAAGERVAMVGPNGSGKSTLLKCLALLERPTFTRMEVLGTDGSIATPPPEKHAHLWAAYSLYCFQRPEDQLYLSSVREELAETSRRLGNAATFDAAMRMAAFLGLEPYLDRSPYDLPRSFRRLIPLAGAFAVDPPVLLLDEPTVGLDDAQVGRLLELLTEKRRTGATLFISHDQAFIAAAATRRLDIRDFQFTKGSSQIPTYNPHT